MGSCTIRADAAYACILAVSDSQVAPRVIAKPFGHGEACIGSPAILEASRVTTLPCQILQPICGCTGEVKLSSPAGMSILPMMFKYKQFTSLGVVRLACMESRC